MSKWIQKATKKMEEKGTKGSFSAAAKRAGKSTGAYATQVLKPGSHASSKTKKKAQFAKNVAGLHGGSTVISRGSMKGKALTEGPKNNKSLKNDFTNGGQRRDNLSLKENPGKPPLFVPGKESAGQMGSSSAVSSNVGVNP